MPPLLIKTKVATRMLTVRFKKCCKYRTYSIFSVFLFFKTCLHQSSCQIYYCKTSVLSVIIFFNLSFNSSGSKEFSHISSHFGVSLTRFSISFSAVWRAIPQVSANLRKSPLRIFIFLPFIASANCSLSAGIFERVTVICFLEDTGKGVSHINIGCSENAHLSSFFPATACALNIASATFTLSIRTVSLPCSSSRTKRSPRPERNANCSCVSPAAFLFSFTNSAIGFILLLLVVIIYNYSTPFRVQCQ